MRSAALAMSGKQQEANDVLRKWNVAYPEAPMLVEDVDRRIKSRVRDTEVPAARRSQSTTRRSLRHALGEVPVRE